MAELETHTRLIVDELSRYVSPVHTVAQNQTIAIVASGGFPKDALHRHQDDWAGHPDLVAVVKNAEEDGLTVGLKPLDEQQHDWELVISEPVGAET